MSSCDSSEILEAMLLNEQSGELSNAVKELRGKSNAAPRSLVNYADSLNGEARTKMFRLLRKHRDKHPVVISLLRRTLELLEKDRHSLSLTAEQKRDLEWPSDTCGILGDSYCVNIWLC